MKMTAFWDVMPRSLFEVDQSFRDMYSSAMVQAASCWLLTVEARVHVHVSPHGFVTGKMALGQVSLQVLQFSPVNTIPAWLSMLIYVSPGE
jgi:hypothetical protein